MRCTSVKENDAVSQAVVILPTNQLISGTGKSELLQSSADVRLTNLDELQFVNLVRREITAFLGDLDVYLATWR